MIFVNIKREKNDQVNRKILKKKSTEESCTYYFVYIKKEIKMYSE